MAFIGGGFNNGIHNLLEPTVFGLPVIFGPNYHKFNEAFNLIDLKAGFVVSNAEELTKQVVVFVDNSEALLKASEIAKVYIQQHSGATDEITKAIQVI